MAELIGEEEARQTLAAKMRRLTGEVNAEVARVYRWYNERVLEDTAAIGTIAARHGMVITGRRGLTVDMNQE